MKRLLCVLGATLLLCGCGAETSDGGVLDTTVDNTAAVETEIVTKVIPKSELGNPVVGDVDNLVYGGDPSVLVDGDTVYLYSGHDASSDEEVHKAVYNIPGYFCYSSSDMIHWNAEGVVMTMDTVTWAADDQSAWASQVAKYNDKYYLYYCSWDKSGKQSIGVAVSDSATGPFVDIGEPLVRGAKTKPATSSFNDIDPTVWIETDEAGEEHRYLAWGNGILYICELNEDMISVKDQNGDGEIDCGREPFENDILIRTKGIKDYTEAPWLYRRSDENGNYYGEYYLFFAYQWRECMAYATTDSLLDGEWSELNIIMYPSATSNTNHMAVCDFKGKTYFIYHNGSLPKGNGYRRSVCIRELVFEEDGSISLMEETTKGLGGETTKLLDAQKEPVGHEGFVNSLADTDYPYTDVTVGTTVGDLETDYQWVIRKGKANPSEETYVSIESENKTGLYITALDEGKVLLSQDIDGTGETYKKQTFKTVNGLEDAEGVSFESIYYEGQYLTIVDGKLVLTDGADKNNATFYLESVN